MVIVALILFQLWDQSSVRMLGFGSEFAGSIPDPITDLLRNPAYLKEFGSFYEWSHNSPQIYIQAKPFEKPIDSLCVTDIQSLWTPQDNPISFMAFYPLIGIGYKLGAFTRADKRNYLFDESWLYGQEGFWGALKIGNNLKIGIEYNDSWNDQPDIFYVLSYDSSHNTCHVPITHLASSNEWGGGVVLSNYSETIWQLAISFKKNKENDNYKADPFYGLYWPDEWPTEWRESRDNVFLFTRFMIGNRNFKLVWQVNYNDNKYWFRHYQYQQDSFLYRYTILDPITAIIFKPQEDMIISAGLSLEDQEYYFYATDHTNGVIIPVGFEKQFENNVRFRMGNTLVYRTGYWYRGQYYTYHIKNQLNFGMDYHPYEKMCIYFAMQNLLDTKQWLFGLSFAL